MSKKYVCLDIGGTKILGAVFDEKNSIIYKVKKKTKAEKGVEQVEETIIKVVEELISESGIKPDELAAIGAGAPGVINEDTGEIIYTPNLPWKNYNIRGKIESKFKVPFYIGNDVNVGVLGEWKFGAGVNKKNIVGIFVGTGIGGGLIVDGKLYTGKRHAAGEVGHMVLNPYGPLCNCGQKGCLEAYAGKVGIVKEIKSQMERGRKTVLRDLMEDNMSILKSKVLKKAVEDKDELALEVMDKAIYYLAAGTGSLINIFNPETVILGGGVIESLGDYMIPILKKYVKRFTMPDILADADIVKASLGDDAGIYGALTMIIEKRKMQSSVCS